jgi:Calcium binding
MATPERIREIIEFVSVDAYTDDEVAGGWGVALDDAATLPFQATALGKPVTILAFDSDLHRGIRCEIQGEGTGRRLIGVDALDEESLPEGVREVLEAFDAWSEGGY